MKNQKEKELINEKDKNKLLEKEKELFDNKNIQNLMLKKAIKDLHYSFECLNVLFLSQNTYQGEESTEIPLMLKNTGLLAWPRNATKLIFDKNFKLKGKDVILNSFEKNEEQKCVVKIEGLSKLPLGEYEAGVYLNIKGHR